MAISSIESETKTFAECPPSMGKLVGGEYIFQDVNRCVVTEISPISASIRHNPHAECALRARAYGAGWLKNKWSCDNCQLCQRLVNSKLVE